MLLYIRRLVQSYYVDISSAFVTNRTWLNYYSDLLFTYIFHNILIFVESLIGGFIWHSVFNPLSFFENEEFSDSVRKRKIKSGENEVPQKHHDPCELSGCDDDHQRCRWPT